MNENRFLVLIVDDLKENRLIIKMYLKKEKYDFIEASNGVEAVEKTIKHNPDIILMDALMPIMDGYDAAKEIRSIDKFYRTSILMITSLSEKTDRIKALEYGINDFITKPIDPIELRARCSSYASLSTINQRYILASINENTNLPNRLALNQDIKSSDNPFLILLKIENYLLLVKFYGEDMKKKIEKDFIEKIPKLLPKEYLDFKLYNSNEGEFLLFKDLPGDFSYTQEKRNCREFYNNVHKYDFSIDDCRYDINISISFGYKMDNLYDQLRTSLMTVTKDIKSVVYANNLAEEIKKNAQENIKITNMIKTALSNDKVVSYFQPIFNNKTKTIEKYESLVRIIDENNKIISPFFFLDISKESKHYIDISQRVIKNSIYALEKSGKEISINISSIDIDNIKIRDLILGYLKNNPQNARKITFEILEDENINNYNEVKEFIMELKKYGSKIAIDDFGVGYSNFERILEIQPDVLKIDASLIKNIETDKRAKKIVETIQSFASNLGMQTVAEFVSNKNIFDIINEIGIDYTQGYYIDEPRADIRS